jgi:hypothetical protein
MKIEAERTEVFKRLYDVEEVRKELGPDPLIRVQDKTMHPRNGSLK